VILIVVRGTGENGRLVPRRPFDGQMLSLMANVSGLKVPSLSMTCGSIRPIPRIPASGGFIMGVKN
jgi:hypothetical protein